MFEKLFAERGLSLDRLRALVEVHNAGSIAQAAPGDLIRQSQYSRQLREISEFFGCEVARRQGKLLKLSARGARLAELARGQLRALEDFRSECREESADFTIAAGDSLLHWFVIPRLGPVSGEFKGSARLVTANLRTYEIVQQLADGRVDFGVVRKDALAELLGVLGVGVGGQRRLHCASPVTATHAGTNHVPPPSLVKNISRRAAGTEVPGGGRRMMPGAAESLDLLPHDSDKQLAYLRADKFPELAGRFRRYT